MSDWATRHESQETADAELEEYIRRKRLHGAAKSSAAVQTIVDPCTELEERAAILEHHAGMGLTREQAERLARKQIDDAERRERLKGTQVELWK